MSRQFAVLGKLQAEAGYLPDSPLSPTISEYKTLIETLFRDRADVAIIGAGYGLGVSKVCSEIASELSRLGKRTVLVSVSDVLHLDSANFSEVSAVAPSSGRSYWLWPPPARPHSDFSLLRPLSSGGRSWLDGLRRDYDAVILDCPTVEASQGVVSIVASAKAAVLAVDASRTPKHQILLDQRRLQSSGVKLAGCILIKAV
jgi:Mrp family chromosome partitioning ATPase